MVKHNHQLYWALLLMAAAALPSCTEIDQIETEVQSEGTTWKVSIETAKPDGDATRGVKSDGNGGLASKWNGDEEFAVYRSGSETSVGTVTAAASDNGTTTLEGTISGIYSENEQLTLRPTATESYSGQTGTIESISTKDFLDETTVTVSTVDAASGILSTTAADFTNKRKSSFTKFTFSEAVHSVVISATGMSNITVTAASGDQTDFYVALPLAGSVEYTFVATTATNIVYYGRKQGNLTHGRYYTASVDLLKELDVTATISSWGDGETLPSGDLPF